MNSLFTVFLIFALLLAAWFAWRYYDLKKRVNEYAQLVRNQSSFPTDVKDLENLSNAIASIRSSFNLQLSTINSDNARLADPAFHRHRD